MDIVFQFGQLKVFASLNQSKTAKAILEGLPIKSKVSRWGDEIYFSIPQKLNSETTTLNVSIGDLAYWPEGSCLCLFFGKTPVSVDDCPRPASEVNLIGTFKTSPDVLRQVSSGTTVQVLKTSLFQLSPSKNLQKSI